MIYCYQILCFSMFNYLNAYKQFLFNLTVILWNVIFPTQNYCVVYISFTGYQMKATCAFICMFFFNTHLFIYLINEN